MRESIVRGHCVGAHPKHALAKDDPYRLSLDRTGMCARCQEERSPRGETEGFGGVAELCAAGTRLFERAFFTSRRSSQHMTTGNPGNEKNYEGRGDQVR